MCVYPVINVKYPEIIHRMFIKWLRRFKILLLIQDDDTKKIENGYAQRVGTDCALFSQHWKEEYVYILHFS